MRVFLSVIVLSFY